MMITRETKQVFLLGDCEYASLDEAKKTALSDLIVVNDYEDGDIYDRILRHSNEVVDILTTTPNSLPKARKIHGGKKLRKAKALTDPRCGSTSSVIAAEATGQISGTAKPTPDFLAKLKREEPAEAQLRALEQ